MEWVPCPDLAARKEGSSLPKQGAGAERPWSTTTWGWSPQIGRWSPGFGQPRGSVSFKVSTDGVAPADAFDYWRDLAYYHFDAQRSSSDNSASFFAQASALATSRGNIYVYESDAVSGQRTPRQIRRDGGEDFSLGIVLEGCRRHRDEQDGTSVAGPGGFFCYDASRPSQVAWDKHRGVHLWMPRSVLQSSLSDLPPASQLINALNASPLAPFLRSHFTVLAAQFDSLSDAKFALVFDQTLDLVLTVLGQVISSASGGCAEREKAQMNAHYAMATRVIFENLGDPTLDPTKIAHMLQISRATLYRAFAAKGITVAGYIREVRLREAMRRLTAASRHVSISTLASQCGFVDSIHFRRLFRDRFGMNPSDVRDLASETSGLVQLEGPEELDEVASTDDGSRRRNRFVTR